MARARNPNRDKAYEIYKEHEGKITNRALAEMLGVPEKTIGSWKSKAKDNWDAKLNGVLQSDERSTPKQKKSTTKKKEVVESVEVIESENDDFTDKQRLFISFYVKYWNATKAYKKAYGCDYATANANGPRLLVNASIREEITRVRDGLSENALLDKRTLIQKWIDIAFADITDYLQFGKTEEVSYNEKGEPELDMNGNIKTWTRSFVNLNESEEVDGTLITEVKQGKDGITVKLADKMKALEYLSKHMDLLNDSELKQLRNEQAKLNIQKTEAEIKKLSEDKDSGPIEIKIVSKKKE
ncbi:terminase small subunit [Lysinibacillus sp. SGAir0095]|uniref:terminase small subunit n=1 Tax=Lysinibacillus sp. SGAir0095 TaxID=2070463 RepID=UPI0010CD4E63|nr:terminase small subunit [Lysinibacillus sp. SGAir0095]QCR33135.1 phage portal protein [Lysinibacillus sp. SGAir0095]